MPTKNETEKMQAKQRLKDLDVLQKQGALRLHELILLTMAVSGAIKLEEVGEDEGAPTVFNAKKILDMLRVIKGVVDNEIEGNKFLAMSDEELIEAFGDNQ